MKKYVEIPKEKGCECQWLRVRPLSESLIKQCEMHKDREQKTTSSETTKKEGETQ